MTDLRIFDPTKVRGIVEGKDAEIAALRAEIDRMHAVDVDQLPAVIEAKNAMTWAAGEIRKLRAENEELKGKFKTPADRDHLERDAKCWRTLRELCGYLGDDSSQTVKLVQDDATRSEFIVVNGKVLGTDRSTFEGILLEIADKEQT